MESASARLALAVDAAGMGTWELDPAAGVAVLSARASELLGRAPGATLDLEALLAGVHPEDRARLGAAIERAVHAEAGSVHADEFRVIPAGGAVRWIQATGRVFHDEQGRAGRILGTLLDVSARRRAEELQALLARASSELASSLDYTTTLRRVAWYAVPAFADWCLIDLVEEGTPRRVEVAHADPAKAPLAAEVMRFTVQGSAPEHPPAEALLSGRPVLIPELTEERLARAAQSPEHLAVMRATGVRSFLAVPLVAHGLKGPANAESRPTLKLGVLTFFLSESGRRYAEADVEFAEELGRCAAIAIDHARLHTRLAESHRRLGLLADASRAFVDSLRAPETAFDGIARIIAEALGDSCAVRVLTPDGRKLLTVGYHDVDPEAAAFMGPRLRATPQLADEGIAGAVLSRRAPVLVADVAPGVVPATYRTPTYRELAERYPVKSGIMAPMLVGERAIGVLALSRRSDPPYAAEDVVLLQELADRAALAIGNLHHLEDVERALRDSEMFVGVLSHDLRSPLNAIVMGAGHLRRTAGSADAAALADRMLSSAHRMARMIEQLLDFTRIRLGQGIPVAPAPMDLAEVARAIVDELRAEHDGRRFEIAFDGDASGRWDRDRLMQVVSNLATNAVKHGAPGAPVRVAIDGTSPERVVLTVDNDGAVAPEALPSLFQPFRGPQGARRSTGLGLGLFITREIAVAHGGTIDVTSSAAEGTRFSVALPRQPSTGRAP